MRRTKGLLRMVVAACLSAVLLPAAPAAAAGKGKGALGCLAKGTLNNVLGNELSSVLTDLGVFEMLGPGRRERRRHQRQARSDHHAVRTDVAVAGGALVVSDALNRRFLGFRGR